MALSKPRWPFSAGRQRRRRGEALFFFFYSEVKANLDMMRQSWRGCLQIMGIPGCRRHCTGSRATSVLKKSSEYSTSTWAVGDGFKLRHTSPIPDMKGCPTATWSWSGKAHRPSFSLPFLFLFLFPFPFSCSSWVIIRTLLLFAFHGPEESEGAHLAEGVRRYSTAGLFCSWFLLFFLLLFLILGRFFLPR